MNADEILNEVESFLDQWTEEEGEDFEFEIDDRVTSFTIIPKV